MRFNMTGTRCFVQGSILHSEPSQGRFLNLTAEEFDSLCQDPIRTTDLLASKVRVDYGTDLGLATFGKINESETAGEYRLETFCSLSTPSGSENQSHTIGGEPAAARERASIIALDMLRNYLLKRTRNNGMVE